MKATITANDDAKARGRTGTREGSAETCAARCHAATDAVANGAQPRSARPHQRPRTLGVLVVLSVIAACFVARGVLLPSRRNVTSIESTPSFQAPLLLAKAWSLPVAKTYEARLAYQRNPTTCGPTSLADVERSWGVATDERSILNGTGRCWIGFCFEGLTLDELAEVARRKTQHHVTVLRGLGYAEFRALLPRFNDGSRRYIANFDRGALMGRGAGHFSPIGGYLKDEDLVFVLDVNRHYEPWLVTPARLFAAIDTEGPEGKRGLLLLD